MPASKSPAGVATIGQLVGFNDELCYAMFADEEMRRGLARLGPALDSLYSTDVFADNSQAKRIHVRIDSLRSFQESHRSFSFAAYLIGSYEAVDDYYDAALDVLRGYGSQRVVDEKGDNPEQRFAATLTLSGYSTIDVNDIRTLTYVRQRRNHLVHLGAQAKLGYQELCRDFGPTLNAYWGTSRESVDFALPAVSPLAERETIGLLKVLRIVIERLDSAELPRRANGG